MEGINVFENILLNSPVNPSGPGALFGERDKIARATSYSDIGDSREMHCSEESDG